MAPQYQKKRSPEEQIFGPVVEWKTSIFPGPTELSERLKGFATLVKEQGLILRNNEQPLERRPSVAVVAGYLTIWGFNKARDVSLIPMEGEKMISINYKMPMSNWNMISHSLYRAASYQMPALINFALDHYPLQQLARTPELDKELN